jgi:hypothetical protein
MTRASLAWLLLGLAAFLPGRADAQSPAGAFAVFDASPFGPGDRSMTGKIRLQPGENTGNVEAWVIYGDNRSAVAGGQLGAAVPHGKARGGVVDSAGVVSLTFVFPHSAHPTPNVADRSAVKYPSGKTLYYKWVKRRGTAQVASEVVEFRMPDKLTIVNFGDSYSSGEGAPYASGAKWGSSGEQCHRSGNSGQAKAVREYKRQHPETAIAFLNVACSGAGVRDGITGSQKKRGFFEDEEFPTRVKPQYEQAKEWLDRNSYEQLNIALVSIGGNDVGFGPLVKSFFLAPGNIADPNDAGARRARENVTINIKENIPLNYDELKRVFDAHFDYDRVLVTAYPDSTRDKDGHFCGKPLTLYGACWGPVEVLNGQAEFQFAYSSILAPLNNGIKAKVEAFPRWAFLDDTQTRGQRHGICNCEVPYINTIGAALADQLDPMGTMHPNRRGHEKIYRPVVLDALEREIKRLRIHYAKAHAKEIAEERVRRKVEAATARSRQPQASVKRAVVESHAKLSPEVLQKARETATRLRRVDDVSDAHHDDDNEK